MCQVVLLKTSLQRWKQLKIEGHQTPPFGIRSATNERCSQPNSKMFLYDSTSTYGSHLPSICIRLFMLDTQQTSLTRAFTFLSDPGSMDNWSALKVFSRATVWMAKSLMARSLRESFKFPMCLDAAGRVQSARQGLEWYPYNPGPGVIAW